MALGFRQCDTSSRPTLADLLACLKLSKVGVLQPAAPLAANQRRAERRAEDTLDATACSAPQKEGVCCVPNTSFTSIWPDAPGERKEMQPQSGCCERHERRRGRLAIKDTNKKM